MPRAPEGCRALPAEGPGVAIQEALAAPAIGPRSEIDLNALFVGRSPRPPGLRTLVNVECGYRDLNFSYRQSYQRLGQRSTRAIGPRPSIDHYE